MNVRGLARFVPSCFCPAGKRSGQLKSPSCGADTCSLFSGTTQLLTVFSGSTPRTSAGTSVSGGPAPAGVRPLTPPRFALCVSASFADVRQRARTSAVRKRRRRRRTRSTKVKAMQEPLLLDTGLKRPGKQVRRDLVVCTQAEAQASSSVPRRWTSRAVRTHTDRQQRKLTP